MNKKNTKPGKMTAAERRERFALAVVRNKGNATAAAIELGYSKKTATSQASRMLANADVQAKLQTLLERELNRERVDAERVLDELGSLAFSNMANYVKVDPVNRTVELEFPDPESAEFLTRMAAVEEITQEEYIEGRGENAQGVRKTKFKLSNKKGALDSLAKILQMVVEKHEHTGKDGGPIETSSADVLQSLIKGADPVERDLLRQLLEHRKEKTK